jgi:hypothetical protein
VLQPVLLLCEPAYRRAHDGRHDARPLHLLHRPHVPLPRQQVPPHFSFNSFTFNLFFVPVRFLSWSFISLFSTSCLSFIFYKTSLINFLFKNLFRQVIFCAKFRYFFYLSYTFTSFYLFFLFLASCHLSLSSILSLFLFLCVFLLFLAVFLLIFMLLCRFLPGYVKNEIDFINLNNLEN